MSEKTNTDHSIDKLRGVGPKVSESLEQLGIYNIQDAVFHLPYRYEDRSKITPLGDAPYEEPVLIEGEIVKSTVIFRGRRMLFTEIYDGTGKLTIRMFHFAMAQHKALKQGLKIRCYGTIRHGSTGREMIHPQYQVFLPSDAIEIDQNLTPVYSATTKLKQGRLRKIISGALEYCEKNNLFEEEKETQQEGEFSNLFQALSFIHKPPASIDINILLAGSHPAQRKLIKEELVAHMLCAGILKNELEGRTGPDMPIHSSKEINFFNSLDFNLTGAQKRTWKEIAKDMTGKSPMRRLLQGDVGSGKTLVGALAALHATENEWQTAFMCPTEILAEQHHQTLSEWFDKFGLRVELLTGSTSASKRKKIISDLYNGDIHILVGTHALFQNDIIFDKLGLTVIDEQHRFGVHQRFSMLEKGGSKERSPHQLIMTATPIPRTLAMTVYGSLETSVIDELPPGRMPVITSARPNSMREKVIQRIAEVCKDGQRAYWVCTLIEESEELEAQSAEELYAEISQSLPTINVGLVHGRLKKKEKDNVINAFREGNIQLLVCTTVIEVGVDVPEATLMIIENPERLGLSQLHQLRGRVGRKANSESHCLLLYKDPLTPIAEERIKTMQETNDGFVIAEKDLELRGAGDIYGVRQSGLMDLKIADPIRDADLLESAQIDALEIAKLNPVFAKVLVDRWIGTKVDYSDS
jgi:ATP-dependent DNA helicase RecG